MKCKMLLVMLTICCWLAGVTSAAQLEADVDRPGGDYRVFDLPAPNPQLCVAACEQDGRCRAFTYVKPGAQGPNARCWLKDEVRAPVRGNNAVISGVVRGGAEPPRNPGYDYDVDRPGGDYRNFDLQAANPDLCAAQCAQDGRCRAWTYVRPGAQGPNPRCWLKDQVSNPVQSVSKAISGVKRTVGPVPPTTPPIAQPPVSPPPDTGGQGVFALQGVTVTDPYQNRQRFVRIDDVKYDSRGGSVAVTALDEEPNRGGSCTSTGAGTQRFRYTWQFSEDLSTLREGQTVTMSFKVDGDQNPCLHQNPLMLMNTDDDSIKTPFRGERFYFNPKDAGNNHNGALRSMNVISGRGTKVASFHVVVGGLTGNRGMELRFEYRYVRR